jgi:hypothetical protein
MAQQGRQPVWKDRSLIPVTYTRLDHITAFIVCRDRLNGRCLRRERGQGAGGVFELAVQDGLGRRC